MGLKNEFRRNSLRLSAYDYSKAGAYFITAVTHGRQSLFGEIQGKNVLLSAAGIILRRCWESIPEHFPHAHCDAWIIMPNHLHGIIIVDGKDGDMTGWAQRAAPLQGNVIPGSLGAVVRSFKSAAAKEINADRGTPGAPVWQRNYFEHIIRNDRDLAATRDYIQFNPLRWTLDEENPIHAT